MVSNWHSSNLTFSFAQIHNFFRSMSVLCNRQHWYHVSICIGDFFFRSSYKESTHTVYFDLIKIYRPHNNYDELKVTKLSLSDKGVSAIIYLSYNNVQSGMDPGKYLGRRHQPPDCFGLFLKVHSWQKNLSGAKEGSMGPVAVGGLEPPPSLTHTQHHWIHLGE